MGLTDSNAASVDASPVTTTEYFFAATDAAGCSESAAVTVRVTGKAEAPTFEPPPGEVDEGTAVTLTSATPDAVVRYTLDGSEVTENATLFTAPLILTTDVTIRARAFKVDFEPSSDVEGAYVVIAKPPVPDEAPVEDDLGTPADANVTEPDEDVTEPDEDVAEPDEDVAEPDDTTEDAVADTTEPQPDVDESDVDVAEPHDDLDVIETDALLTPGDVEESSADVTAAEPAEDVIPPRSDVTTADDVTTDSDVGARTGSDVRPTVTPSDASGGCNAGGRGGTRAPLALGALIAMLLYGARRLRAAR